MALKLPRATIEELDELVEQLTKPDPNRREEAIRRLENYERSGRLPVEALVEFSASDQAPLSMYAISALGRNGQPAAVKRLAELVEAHRDSNELFLATIVDALGETRNPSAASALLGLLGVRKGWTGRLFGRRSGKEEDEATERLRERMAVPVLRALEKVQDPKAAELLGDYLQHEDHLVRWHAVQLMAECGVVRFNDRLREMSTQDPHNLVREAAELALGKLEPLPPNQNN